MQNIKIHPIGPFVLDEYHALNTYLIETERKNMLYDLVPIQSYPRFRQLLVAHHSIEQVDLIIISNMHMSMLSVIEQLISDGFKGEILTNHFFARQIKNAFPNLRCASLEESNNIYLENNEEILRFIPVIFLPYPKMFLTYLPKANALFSGTLFSSYRIHQNDEDRFLSFDRFHENMMPSSQFFRIPLQIITELRIDTIYPLYGEIYTIDLVHDAMKRLQGLNFYNQSYPYKEKAGLKRIHDFKIAIEEMLAHLIKRFGSHDVLELFQQSMLEIDATTHVIQTLKIEGFALWNRFFEHIYQHKGYTWLSILEVHVKRYAEGNDLPLPAIYSSESIKLLETAKSLGIEKKELEERLSLLHEAILESRDASIKNQTTGLYIQSVLYELIHKHYMDEISEPIKFSMLLIHLDQLQSINQRYGKRAGDDALRTAVYLVEQLKDSNCLLFNQFGPGLILFKYGASEMDLKQGALILKRAFSESVLFIEPVTISCAIVSSDEVQAMDIDDRVRNLFDYLERRMNEAKRKGYGEIVGLQETSNVRIEGTILLVDEDPLARNMLLRIFKRIDYEVMIATSVMEAYQAIEKHPIDVVISEINLSKLDGFELKRMLNASIYRNVPFYMVSHNKTVENIKRANILGVDLIIEKPIVAEEIIGLIQRAKERLRTL